MLIEPIAPDRLTAYAGISPAFTVTSILKCEPAAGGLGGIRLCEEPVVTPYRKYEGDHDEPPAGWAQHYDLSAWGLFLATEQGRPLGGAAVAPPLAGMVASRGRMETAVLWDLRVAPAARGGGIGTALLKACAAWARDRGYLYLSIETQNTNVPACRFYARAGCELAEIRRFGYAGCPEVAHEAMLIWQLAL